jgi:phage FluMu gp28-like protein
VIEELAFTYPTWFFEILSELEGKPLELEDFQIRYLLDESTMKVTNKTRQSGGSMQLALAKFFKAYRNPAYRCDIVSINLKEATDKIKYVRNFWESLPKRYRIPLTIDNALSIGFHKGMRLSVINSLAASAGIRGGRKDVVFDEFAHIMGAEELFHSAAPAIMNGNLGVDLVSTPLGNLNLFAKIYNNEPNEFGDLPYNGFSRHQFIWLDVKRFVTDYEKVQSLWYGEELNQDMGHMRELVMAYGTDKLKMFYYMYPWDQFKQEFCGAFLSEVDQFFPNELIQKCLRGTVGTATDGKTVYREEFLEKWHERPKDNISEVFIGIDFGESDKESDKTSIQVLERDYETGRFLHRYSEVLDKEKLPSFPAQARYIADLIKRMRPTKVACDETGLGRGIVPLLREYVPEFQLEGVNFNTQSKEAMVMTLKTLMEQDMIWLQADDIKLQGQIRNIRRDVMPSGIFRYHGEPFDDMFWALALASRGGAYTEFAMYSIGSSSSSHRRISL